MTAPPPPRTIELLGFGSLWHVNVQPREGFEHLSRYFQFRGAAEAYTGFLSRRYGWPVNVLTLPERPGAAE